MSAALLIIFLITSFFLIISPGQDMLLVMSRSISQGWKAGVTTAAGVSVGLLGHTVLATLGLGAVLQGSDILFLIMKTTGAAYLFYLGIKFILTASSDLDISRQSHVPLRKLFFQGVFSNISNPKIVIFYLAYLPQFIPLDGQNPTTILFILGCVFSLLTFSIKGPIACVAGLLSNWLSSRPKVVEWINRTSGFVLIGMGLRLFFEKNN